MKCNQDYQRELARTLVEGCGVDDAIEFAQQNSWDGVLDQIINAGTRGKFMEFKERNSESR